MVTTYINRFLLKLDKVYPKSTDQTVQQTLDKHFEKSKIEHFINALVPALKSCLIIKKPDTLDEAIKLAREYGQQLSTVTGKPPPLSIAVTEEIVTPVTPSTSSESASLDKILNKLETLHLTERPRSRPIMRYVSPSDRVIQNNNRRYDNLQVTFRNSNRDRRDTALPRYRNPTD